MGLFDRLSRVVRANLNDMVSKAEDPEKILEQAVTDMQEDLVQLRQAVARAIAEQRQTEQKFSKEQTEAGKWEQRAKLALSKGDEGLAREALKRKKDLTETATILRQQLDQQSVQVESLRKNLMALESKISEAKTKKNMLQARVKAAKANEDVQKTLSGIDTSSSMSAFERMEEKVIQLESRSQAYGELGGMGIENEFLKLEAGNDVDDELEALKMQLSGSSPTQTALPPQATTTTPKTVTDSVVDAELEDLRKKLDGM
ncbi:MAG: Phage shock protein A [Chroococcopsis gigantea SAG 12.99]|jgi:phage shock protein A|nr:Phage shock protein A [Chroococcopsis gigantea SAG 12.99]